MITGGCQCGAVRFAAAGPLGRASLCHCRMCQKAFGGFYGPLVGLPGLRWTRGAPRYFASSNRVKRGFCGDCGTPLTFEPDGGVIDVAIGALDDPAAARPAVQLATDQRLPWLGDMDALPGLSGAEAEASTAWRAQIVSRQHPDHDTAVWPQ
jgi:hypothetical protein